MRIFLLGFCISCLLMFGVAVDFGTGCKPAETAAIETTILDLGNAECAFLAQQPNEPVAVIFTCEVFDLVQVVIQTFEVQVPATQAATFAAEHPVKAGHRLPAGAKP